MNVSILLVIDRSPVDFVLQIDVIYPSMKVALFTARHVKIRKTTLQMRCSWNPDACWLVPRQYSQHLFVLWTSVSSACAHVPFCPWPSMRTGWEHLLGVQGGPFAVREMSFCAPKCLVTQVRTSVFFHLKVFNLNMCQKARKIVYFHRSSTFLVWLYCSTYQEFIVTEFGMFSVGFSGDLASVWHWPTMEELEGLILKIYISLEEVGKKTIYHDQTYFSLRLVVHW